MISRFPLSIIRTQLVAKNIIAHNLHRKKVKNFKLGEGGGEISQKIDLFIYCSLNLYIHIPFHILCDCGAGT